MKVLLIVACCLALSSANLFAGQPAPVLYVAMPNQFPDQNYEPLLMRELARQSLLIAARDGIGLDTRDAVLREWQPDAAGNPPADALSKPALSLNLSYAKDTQFMQMVVSTVGADPQQLLSRVVPARRKWNAWISIPKAVEDLEPPSRGEFIDKLKALGYVPQIAPAGDLDIPDGVDNLLYQTTLFAPYSALQQVHAAIRETGESPKRISALVRAYANLAQLTAFQWSSISKVMQARSLLYAHRMVNQDPDSPFSYYNRAYAYAFCGLQAAALEDLDQAHQLEDALQPAPPVPHWVPMLEPFCKYDLQALAHLGPHGDISAPLISMLTFLDVENCGSLSELMESGNASLQLDGNCFRILDVMTSNAGVISGHELTERAPQVMLDTLPADIKLLKVIPQSTQQALQNAHGNADHTANLIAVTHSFLTATEPAEPSFALAGRLLQETTFMHVVRRVAFMKYKWGVDCADYVDQTATLIAEHPYRDYVGSFKLPYAQSGEVTKSIEIIDPQWQMYDLIVAAAQFPQLPGRMTGLRTWNRITSPADITSQDAERMLLHTDPTDKPRLKDFAHKLLEVNPYSAVAASILVTTDFKFAKPRLDEWTRQFAHQPIYLVAIAQHWSDLKQTDKQIDVLKQLIAVAPDAALLEKLAKIYLDRGDEPSWLSTMLLVLKQPDYQLDHSYAEYLIASHFMDTGKYDIARKYADASLADSGSGWAMECDARAAELQGDYIAAEKMYKDSDPYGWFQFCKRTGHGDVAAATEKVDAWLNITDPSQVPASAQYLSMVRYLERRQDEAKKYFQMDMQNTHSCLAALQLAFIAIDMKDDAGRDAALNFATKSCRTSLLPDHRDNSDYADFADLVLAAKDRLPTDQQIQSLLQADNPSVSDRAGIYYFEGKLLQLRGDTDGAKKYLKLATQHPLVSNTYLLACDALHQLGETTQ